MNFTVVKSLHRHKPPALYPDISEREMYSIGKMTASWALLESLLIQMTLGLARNSPHTLPPDFVENITLEKTLMEFKTLIKLIEKPEALKSILGNILNRTNNLKAQRHMLTHGIFTWEISKPGKLKVNKKNRGQSTIS